MTRSDVLSKHISPRVVFYTGKNAAILRGKLRRSESAFNDKIVDNKSIVFNLIQGKQQQQVDDRFN